MGLHAFAIIGGYLLFIVLAVYLVFMIIVMVKANKALSIYIRKNDTVQTNSNENQRNSI